MPADQSNSGMARRWWLACIDTFFKSKEFTLGAAFAAAALVLWLVAEYPALRGNLDSGLAMLLALVVPFVLCAFGLLLAARLGKRWRGAAFAVLDLRVLGRIVRDFPRGKQARVAQRLEGYSGPERGRVVLAILDLSQGDAQRLAHFCQAAETDFRDVLMWQEEGTRR